MNTVDNMSSPHPSAEPATLLNEQPIAWVETSRANMRSKIAHTLEDSFTLVFEKYPLEQAGDLGSAPGLSIIDVAYSRYSQEELAERLGPDGLPQHVAVLLILPESKIDELQPYLSRDFSEFLVDSPSSQELKVRVRLLMARLKERSLNNPVVVAQSWDNGAQDAAHLHVETTSVGISKLADDPSHYWDTVQALKESEAKFRTIANAMPQMVWSTRPDGYHDYYNQQWYDFTGAPEGSTDGDGWNGMFHPDDQARAWKAWRHSLATGDRYEIEYRVRHHSGDYRWTLGRALPVRNDAGEIIRWMGTCTVIHDQKMAEEALKDASRRKDEFLAMLAHELRNPLAPLYNSAVLLRRSGEIRAENAQTLDVIERQIKHMTRLVGDLMDVARVTSGKVKLQRVPCELNSVISQAAQDFRYLLDDAGIHFSTECSDEPLWIKGDATRIVQAVGNLLHNAAKFTPAGGSVRMTTARVEDNTGEHAVVTVKDSGEGIDPKLTTHMFSPFIQAEQGLDRGKGGLGLGLALVKGFMELHGGSVTVESEGKGRGAAFTLSFPCGDIPEEIPESQAGWASSLLRKLRIVLIEDNKDTIATLSMLLTMDGHDVTTAEDGTTGINAIETAMPDVVICDIGLPGSVDGYAVARAVRERAATGSHKPFMIALSGYGHDDARRNSKKSGFDIHLLKPLELGELNRVLSENS